MKAATPPNPSPISEGDDMRRFLEKRAKIAAAAGPDACWVWPAKDGSGYGRAYVGRRSYGAHRLSWAADNGEIPPGTFICHHCDNPLCINPRHLYAGSPADNMRDMVKRGRAAHQKQPERWRELTRACGRLNTWSRGTTNPNAKLSAEQVAEIRASKLPPKELMARFSVSRSAIYKIRSGLSHRSQDHAQ